MAGQPDSTGHGGAMSMEIEASYIASCLPKTMDLADLRSEAVLPHLRSSHDDWYMPDRLLVWICPTMLPAVSAFYRSDGKRMTEMSSEEQLKSLDDALSFILAKKVEKIRFG